MPANKDLPLNNIFIPSKTVSKKLMVILHGRGDSSRGFTFLPGYLNLDNMNYLLLNAPYFYHGGFSWYDLPPNQLKGIIHSSSILTDIFDTLFEEEFNAEESFLFGFSQGALMTFEFGARYEKVLKGYIAVSGYIYDPKKLLKEMNPNVNHSNWLCTHGTYDDILTFEKTRSQIEFLQDNGFNITFKSYPKGHSVAEEELQMISEWIKTR
jgi:phospholipase/carboxylesterase